MDKVPLRAIVRYPLKSGRLVLRVDGDWNANLEPVAVSGADTFEFEWRSERPFAYFKPVLIEGSHPHLPRLRLARRQLRGDAGDARPAQDPRLQRRRRPRAPLLPRRPARRAALGDAGAHPLSTIATVRRPGKSVYDAIGRQDLTTDDVYWERGINLLHGFLSEQYVDSEEHIMDLPGFGLTGSAPDGDYSLPAYVRFVVAVMDQLGVKQAVLAGNSLGGYIAWKVAADHPERVSRLVLVDAAGYPTTAVSMPIGFRLAQVPALRPVLANILPRRMIVSSVRNVYGHPERVTPELVDRYFDLTLRAGNRQALGERFRQNQNGEFASQVKQLRQPTLILWGGQDRLIPPETADLFLRDTAGSGAVRFEDLGHVPHEEDPARTVLAVQAFLAG